MISLNINFVKNVLRVLSSQILLSILFFLSPESCSGLYIKAFNETFCLFCIYAFIWVDLIPRALCIIFSFLMPLEDS